MVYRMFSNRRKLTRRDFLKALGIGAAATTFPFRFNISKAQGLSGSLRILQWSHFVPRYDTWFDEFARQWGEENGVEVTVDHINLAEIGAATASEIAAGEGHDLIEWLSPPSSLEPSVLDLRDVNEEAVSRFGEQIGLATRSSYNPTTEKYYGFCHSWVPDPGNYRISLWDQVGMPQGPTTWQELLDGGKQIKDELGVQMGLGMSNELDSNLACRAVLWAFGGLEQDASENIAINSPETIAALEYMKELYENTMTPEVFSWVPASNNQLLIAGQASYILNSISAYRTAQTVDPVVADDIGFIAPLVGPAGAESSLVSEHVIPIYVVPTHAANPDAAKEFMLALTENTSQIVLQSELYNFPSFFDMNPELLEDEGWLDVDPYNSNPIDKLQVLKGFVDYSTVIGQPGSANPAIAEVFNTFIIPQMFAKVATGDMAPDDAVAEAEALMIPIYERWLAEGLIGGGR
jgi:ABC-type glycerol-3-phosphate transport system substrate-binding protein